jgi:E2/UBC family protein E
MRREFQLPAEDVRFLERLGLPWETIVQGPERWVLVHGHPLPAGYDHTHVTVAILISGGYPEALLDMFYLLPVVARPDGAVIPATSAQAIDGKTYQRWSRHRPGDQPWRPGIDNLETHFDLTRDALDREFVERPCP